MSAVNIENAFKSKDYQKQCDANGLRGFPIYMTQKTYADAKLEPNYRLRPQFQQPSLWTYDMKTGAFDDGAFTNSTYVLQGKHYRIAHIRVVNRKGHHEGTAELNIWATTSASANQTYSLLAIPIVPGSASTQGLKLRDMLAGSKPASLEDIFPQGDDINVYFYTTCVPYVNVGKDYKPLSYASASINVAFFNYPIVLDGDVYKRLVDNTTKSMGIPKELVGNQAVFSELLETDTHNTVKIVKTYDISEQMKAETIRKKVGFRLSKDKKQDYKVFEVDPTKLADKDTYKVDLEEGEDLDSYLKRTAKPAAVAEESTIGPGTIARWLGWLLGIVLGVGLVLLLWYILKKLYAGTFGPAPALVLAQAPAPALAQAPVKTLVEAPVQAQAQPVLVGGSKRLPPIVKI